MAFQHSTREDLHLVVLGFGRLEEEVKEVASRTPNVHFKASVPMEELLKVTAGADIGFSMLSRDCENHENTLPNKLFEYIAARIPIIVSPVREMSRYVKEYDLGYVLEENTPEAIVAVIEGIHKGNLQQFKQALEGRSAVFTWEEQEKKLIALYDRVLSKS